MISAKTFLNIPLEFQNICKIYPVTVAQVVSNTNFPFYEKIITISQEEIEDEFTENGENLANILTPLEYLLNLAFNSEEYEKLIKDAFAFFIHEDVTFIYQQKKILVGSLEEVLKEAKNLSDLRMLTEDNYFDFQNMVRDSVGSKKIEPPIQDENPRIKEMKAKARLRDKVKAEKEKDKGINLTTTIASICCMNFGLNPLNVGEISYAALLTLSSFYQQKEKYQTDIDSILAGADSKKVKPVYWIKNLED